MSECNVMCCCPWQWLVRFVYAEVLVWWEVDIRTRCQVPARLCFAHRGACSRLLRVRCAASPASVLHLQRRICDSCGCSTLHDLCECNVLVWFLQVVATWYCILSTRLNTALLSFFCVHLQVLTLLFITSAQDPGIVPRASHPPEEEFAYGNPLNGGTPGRLQFPRVKEIMVNGMLVKVKYCDTCMIYRPPRCSHCSICNNCVERFDHHCPWVGQCIGQVQFPCLLKLFQLSWKLMSSTESLTCYIYLDTLEGKYTKR